LTSIRHFGIVWEVKWRRVLRLFVVGPLIATSLAGAVAEAAVQEPITVRNLPRQPTSFARIERGAATWGPAFAGGRVFVSTDVGVAAYPRHCRGECDPLWRSNLPDEWEGYRVNAKAGHVAVEQTQALHLFDADCASDGSICKPRWSLRQRILSAHLVGSSVIATKSTDYGIRVAGYPLRCSNPCSPTWIRRLRSDPPAYGPPVVAHDVLYLRGGSVLWGIALDCVMNAGPCSVVFRVGHVPDATFPAVTPRRVIFGTGYGPGQSQLAAYPTGCGHDCSPVWTANAGGYVGDPPTLAGTMVVTSSVGHVTAVPIRCPSPCSPAWTADVPEYPVVHYADADRVIAISHRGTRAVYAFSTECASDCRPSWSYRYADESREPRGTASDGRHIFVAFPNYVVAYNLATGRRAWRGSLHSGTGWWLDAGRRSLVVYLRRDSDRPSDLDRPSVLDTFVATPTR
jgi:hypothetical protein